MARREEAASTIIKRRVNRVYGVFIDGTGLDRATRRLNKRVDISALLRGLTAGAQPEVSRYYTIIPYEDDSRHRAFLDAVERSGLSTEVKRLPPKGITRQVTVDVEMASDIIAFASGKNVQRSAMQEHDQAHSVPRHPVPPGGARRAPEEIQEDSSGALEVSAQPADVDLVRVVVVVCPSREMAYPIGVAKALGADTVSADFGGYKNEDVLKSAAKWVDLSDSETIWKD